MAPIADSAVRGYPDMQRIDNWDSGLLFEDEATVRNAPIASPVMDVSRYAYLGGFDICQLIPVAVRAIWTADNPPTLPLGNRDFALTDLITGNAQYRLPNLGPYCQLTYTPMAAGNWRHTARIIGTNRVHPLEFIPDSAVLIDVQAQNVAAAATVTVYPTDYYAGPVQVWSVIGQTSIVWLEYLAAGAVWHQLAQETVAAAANSVVDWATPPGAWRINVKNTGAAAGSLFLAVTPSTTGAL